MSVPTEWRLKGESDWTPISEDLNKTQIGDSFKFFTFRTKPSTCNTCCRIIRRESMIRVIVDTPEGITLNYHPNHLPDQYKNKIEFR